MRMLRIGAAALGCAAMMSPLLMQAQCNGMAGGKSHDKGAVTSGSDQDKQFLMQASQSDFNEITFSNLALQQSTNAQVKLFAQKMVTDHTKLDSDMKPFADQMSVAPPNTLDAQHQQLYDQLKGLSGADFDKQYISDMDTDHHAALSAYQTELSSTQDAPFKPVVKKGEKVVAEHTKMADKLSKQMGGTANGM